MKRDLDLCRELMLAFEATPAGDTICTLQFERAIPWDMATCYGHIQLLIDAGFLEGEAHYVPDLPEGGMLAIDKITWAGHDFIDSARSEGVWSKAKSRLTQAGSWTWALAMEILKEEAKRQIGGLLH